MSDIKVIYKNAHGMDQEHSEAADSIKLLSLKLATTELTDAKLANLIDGAENNPTIGHLHDNQYFKQTQFISSTTGVADAGKPIKTDAAGLIPSSFLNLTSIESGLTHDALSDVANSTAHTKFLMTDGSRNLTAVQAYSSALTISADPQLVHKKYVDDAIVAAHIGTNWLNAATRLAAPPASPATGLMVLVDSQVATLTGAFVGHNNTIATWSGTAWSFYSILFGQFVSVDNEPSLIYQYNGTILVAKIFEATTASTGLVKSGLDIQVDPSLAGSGLGFSAGALAVNVDASSIEIVSDSLKVKNLGIKTGMVDFGTGAGQVQATALPISDSANYFTTKNVEAALAQLASEIQHEGVTFIAGLGGVTKGDLVYISAANTVSTYNTLTSDEYVAGVAANSAVAGASVIVLENNTELSGVLTGAAINAKVYWDGNGYVYSIPTGSGKNVYRVGTAMSATSLFVSKEHVKKQS
jgi:hypothetical protein